MKNKILVSSILTIALCLSMIAGSTFALFTSESQVNVAVTSGEVSVLATASNLQYTSDLGSTLGQATLSDKADSITVEGFTPGDRVSFDITVANESTVAINYRTVVTISDELAPALEVSFDDVKSEGHKSAWTKLDAGADPEKVTVSIYFPDADNNNDYMGKTCNISYVVEAVQGNTIPVESFEELTSNSGTSGSYTVQGDIETDNMLYFGPDTTNVVNLQGNLTATNSARPAITSQSNSDIVINADNDTVIDCTQVVSYPAVYASTGNVTLNGGTYQLGETNQKSNIYCQNNGLIVINDGNYISSDANTPILYCINGYIEINGGFFQNTANSSQPLIGMGNNLSYVNNQKVTLSGGTFVNWNPMSSAFAQAWPESGVPALIVLAEGYQMISETQANGDVWYMVVPQ